MIWHNPMPNKKRPEPKGGWTKDDTTSRCNTCGYPDGGGNITGTPLSQITVSVSSSTDPYIPVAKAVVCVRCNRVYHIKTLPAAGELNISLAGIEACMRASRDGTAFRIDELQEGKLKMELSDSVKKLLEKRRPTPHFNERTGEYNPDAFIEPAQESLPL